MAGTGIGLELRSVNNLIRRYFEFASHKREIDSVTGNNGWIIGYLADHSDRNIFQKDIEEHFTITRSTASKVLTLMEQKGLIKRCAVEQDARLKRIVLTDKAWEIRKMMMQDGEALERVLTDGLEEEEIDALHRSLRKMRENLSKAMEKK